MTTSPTSIDLGLASKRGLVAGAGYRPSRAGMGRLTTLKLAAAGVSLACIDIDQGRADDIVAEVVEAGGQAVAVVADMTDPAQSTRAVDAAVEALGGLDLVVDIIGGAKWSVFGEFSDEDWRWTLDNNISHAFYLYRAASAHMIRQGTGGSLVALASVDGIGSAAYHVAYGVAKAGIMSLTKTTAEELGRHGIRANAVAPGAVAGGNEDQPDDQWGTDGAAPLNAPRARDIANAVLFLSSELAARITGQTLVVDGGATIKSPWGLSEDSIAFLKDF
jgi:3-oxoacyl-[acyl-carrier protein] reductase